MSNDYRAYVECDYNSIYHHGIKGMKWGVRRYQNEDGTLTPEGRRKYGKLFDKYKKQGYSNRDALALAKNSRSDGKKRAIAALGGFVGAGGYLTYKAHKDAKNKKPNSNRLHNPYGSELKSRYDKVKKENPKWLKDNFGNDSFKDIMYNDPDLLYLALEEYDHEKKSKRRSR